MVDDRRLHPRYPVAIDVTLRNGTRTRVVESRDVSLGGTFLCTASPAEMGEPIFLVLHLPGDGEVRVRCRVIHVLRGRGMGIQFTQFLRDGRLRLERFLARLTPAAAADACGGMPAEEAARRGPDVLPSS